MALLFSIVLIFSLLSPWYVHAQTSAIIWAGDYETGDSSQWHNLAYEPQYNFMPAHGRPPEAGGDGSLFSVVTNPVRQGTYAAKITVLNSINGTEPDDCDVPFPTCYRRRTEMNVISALCGIYNALPYMSERWISVSYFVPDNWDDGGSGWGIHVLQIKPFNDGAGPAIAIDIRSGAWRIHHSWSDTVDPSRSDGDVMWYHEMYYAPDYPVYNQTPMWNDGVADFVDPVISQAALADLNRGGWTDWIIHVKFDAKGQGNNGTGFLKFWKRKNNEDWIPILDIRPRLITRGGYTFDRGIGFNSPPKEGSTIGSYPNNGGFGIAAGMYLQKEQVWDLPNNRVIYQDNIKIGSENATFEMMTPEYSDSPLRPPQGLRLVSSQ